MSFFDKILKAVGFESDEEETFEKPKKEKKQKTASIAHSAKFDLSAGKTKSRELSTIGENEGDEEDISVYNPKTQKEIESIIIKVKSGENALVNFAYFSENDRTRALDFMSGALFLLNGKIQKVEGTLFLITLSKENYEFVE